MRQRILSLAVLTLVPACTLPADFTYEQTSTITGGAMQAMMKLAGAFSKQAREPIKNTVIVKGDKMLHVSANRTSIIDLAGETITEVDHQKKTYSVMTFAEMKQFLEQMSQKMNNGQGAELKVSANATGNTRTINGLDAKEVIIKMEMENTDPKTGQKGSMVITTDSWFAAGVAGYAEVRDFQKRMAEKLNWAPGGGMMMNRPDIAKGMAAVYKELANMDGVPVLQIVKMGGAGQPGAQNAQMTPEQQPQAEQPQQAQPQQAQQQPERPTSGGVLGGALGGRLGRFGGLGRKKQPQQEEQPQQQQQQAQPAPTPAASRPPSGDPGSLLEMTTEVTNFSAGPADSSKFDVPSNYKKVESDMKRMR